MAYTTFLCPPPYNNNGLYNTSMATALEQAHVCKLQEFAWRIKHHLTLKPMPTTCIIKVLTKFQTPQIVHGVVPRFDDLIGKKVGFEGGGAHTVTLGTLCSSIEELPTFCWELLAAISNGQSVSVNDQAWRSLAIDMTQFSSALQGGEF
jgi:hypothetical protein